MPIKGLIDRKIRFVKRQVNALTGKIRIKPDHRAYYPGDTVKAEISIELSQPMDARSLEVRLYCVESSKTVSQRVMDSYDYQEDKDLGVPRSTHLRTTTSTAERTIHSERRELSGHKVYESGHQHVEFTIPYSAPHTRHHYSHDGKKAVWRLEAKLDVPMAIDISSSKEIIVKHH